MTRPWYVCLVVGMVLAGAIDARGQIGPNLLQNGGPTTGVPYTREGSEPETDSDLFGDEWNDGYAHYRLRGIDQWKYERVADTANFHRLTFDYDTQATDMSFIGGDRYVAFIQGSNVWGDEIPVQLHRKVRTVLQFEVMAKKIPGTSSFFHAVADFTGDPLNFGRMGFSTHPIMADTSGTAVTVDFDFWEKQSHLNQVSNPHWWFKGGALGNDGTQSFPTEYFPRWQANGSGVVVMPVEGLRQSPQGLVNNVWVHVVIDLSWAYEWTLALHASHIEDAGSYTFLAPPTIWRYFAAIEGCNLRAQMQMRNLQLNEYDLHDAGTLATYRALFASTTTKSYPFGDRWLDSLQYKFD